MKSKKNKNKNLPVFEIDTFVLEKELTIIQIICDVMQNEEKVL